MKKLIFATAVLTLSAVSCTGTKEERNEEKRDLSADHMRNTPLDDAAVSGGTTAPAASDSATVHEAAQQ